MIPIGIGEVLGELIVKGLNVVDAAEPWPRFAQVTRIDPCVLKGWTLCRPFQGDARLTVGGDCLSEGGCDEPQGDTECEIDKPHDGLCCADAKVLSCCRSLSLCLPRQRGGYEMKGKRVRSGSRWKREVAERVMVGEVQGWVELAVMISWTGADLGWAATQTRLLACDTGVMLRGKFAHCPYFSPSADTAVERHVFEQAVCQFQRHGEGMPRQSSLSQNATKAALSITDCFVTFSQTLAGRSKSNAHKASSSLHLPAPKSESSKHSSMPLPPLILFLLAGSSSRQQQPSVPSTAISLTPST